MTFDHRAFNTAFSYAFSDDFLDGWRILIFNLMTAFQRISLCTIKNNHLSNIQTVIVGALVPRTFALNVQNC